MDEEEKNDKAWKKFLKNHWQFCLVIAAGIIGAVIAGVFVFLWLTGKFQAEALVPAVLGQWTVGYTVTFVLNIVLWEFIIIGIPIIAAVATIYLLWWRRLPEEERAEYEKEDKKKCKRDASGAGGFLSFLVTITWLIIVWANDMWNTAFQAWTFDFLISSWLWAILWDLLIFGIPIALGAIWWLHQELKE